MSSFLDLISYRGKPQDNSYFLTIIFFTKRPRSAFFAPKYLKTKRLGVNFTLMKKQDKIFEAQNLAAKIKDAKSVALVDYRGLTVAQATELRNKIREAGGELQVVKNNLFRRALRENSYNLKKENLEGPTLALFANEDEATPLKAIVDFGKNIGLLPLKMGFMAGKILSSEEMLKLAFLPGKKELQRKLARILADQPRKLVYGLNWNIQKLALVLNAIKDKKQ